MASKAIKRRPSTCSSVTDKTSEKGMETTVSDPITAPLLANGPQSHQEKSKRFEPTTQSEFWDGTRQECLRWVHLLSVFIAQSARKIVSVLSEFGSLLSRLFGCSCACQSSQYGQTVPINLSPLQMSNQRGAFGIASASCSLSPESDPTATDCFKVVFSMEASIITMKPFQL